MLSQEVIVFIIEVIGTIAFASAGAMSAIKRKLDLFGIVMFGGITAVGGGMLRDILLGLNPPALFRNPTYAYIAIVVSILLFMAVRIREDLLTSKYMKIYKNVMNSADAIGLGAFTVIGVNTGYDNGYESTFLLIALGALTGVGGGMLRDMMSGETPQIFRKHVYACASIAGAGIYIILNQVISNGTAMIIGAISIIAIRYLSAKYEWNLPKAIH